MATPRYQRTQTIKEALSHSDSQDAGFKEMPTTENLTSGTARKGMASLAGTSTPMDESDCKDDRSDTVSSGHKCEVCGTGFETRRGLSSHARSHLRQLGVAVSDSSGAPIDLLYSLIAERDGHLPFVPPKTTPQHKTPSPKKDSGTKLKIKISNLVKKKYSPFSPVATARKGSASLSRSSSSAARPTPRSAPPAVKKVAVLRAPSPLRAGRSPPPSAASTAVTKPLWAPQETDAPLNLTMMNDAAGRDDVHVCELCGAWFETRKGLSSHARAHLRQFGVVNEESKGAPIELLHQILQSEDFQNRTVDPQSGELAGPEGDFAPPSTPSTSLKRLSAPAAFPGLQKATSKGPASCAMSPPPSKRLKPSSDGAQGFSPSPDEPLKEIVCELCGEFFKKTQSLSSHCRSHLRQLGVTEWTVNGSPILTLREVMARRGLTCTNDPPPPPLPPLSASPSPLKHSSAPPPHKLPKARKGTRLVHQPKDEPMEVDVSAPESWSSPSGVQALHAAPKPELEPLQVVSCDYCGELFDSRKALSCHARAHLRQLGVKWAVNGSPIDTLQELMVREGSYRAAELKQEPGSVATGTATQWRKPASSPRTFTPSPVDFSTKGKGASDNGAAQSACDATCELCGFDFENRKALASHARAHLRQLGVEWPVNGSPIETLSAWMQREPGKVAELHQRYMRGDLPHIKRTPRSASSPSPSTDSEPAHSGSYKPLPVQRSSLGLLQGHRAAREVAAGTSGSSRAAEGRAEMSHSSQRSHGNQGYSHLTHNLTQLQVARSELNVRLPRGCERRPPKHLSHTESRAREARPPQPPRAGTIPSLVPRPPATPLVKLVGKVYSLRCRFCEEEFCGPLSIQEDWVRHLQQHILSLKRDAAPSSALPDHSPQPISPALAPTPAPLLVGPQAV